ncbi:dynein heavy chain 8, axonemal kl-3 [Lycorma delicatula]|uniref:dynein heavy chain 8, axonemal kl-3 n=1 Tax=Lycorma delicatula TaxID=130591 RepID=UPI003F516D84
MSGCYRGLQALIQRQQIHCERFALFTEKWLQSMMLECDLAPSLIPSSVIGYQEPLQNNTNQVQDTHYEKVEPWFKPVCPYLSNTGTKKKKKSQMLLLQQQTMRQKMAKAKEARAERAARLRNPHRIVMEMVAFYMGIELGLVEEGVLDADYHVETFDTIFIEGGNHAVMFNYQELSPPGIESGRSHLMPKSQSVKRVTVVDVKNAPHIPLNGICVIVYRTRNNFNAEVKQVYEEYCYASIHVDNDYPNVVCALYNFITSVCYPVLQANTNWGALNKQLGGKEIINSFIYDIRNFVHYMKSTKDNLSAYVKFDLNEELYKMLSNHDSLIAASLNPATVMEVENVVRIWIRKMESVLTESEMLRREPIDIAPQAELEHWRYILAKFTSIVEHFKTPECKTFVQLLVQAYSKLVKKWKSLDNRITFSVYEATDNVKYLEALEKYWEPLYRSEPTTIGKYLKSLLFAIRMAYATSRYFNTIERITALLVKVTNQILNSCYNYLTVNKTRTIWQQKKKSVIEKMKVCLCLYKYYYSCFLNTKKENMESENESELKCSEMFVFGKFETFKVRLEQLIDVLEIALKYSILESSKIEGIEEYAAKFNSIYKIISSKPYDALNHRKPDFDNDYEIFKESIINAEKELKAFMEQTLGQIPKFEILLTVLDRFDKLNLESLNMTEAYINSIDKFRGEIENLRDHYNEYRTMPAIPWTMPPLSGRITWIRQLYQHMRVPMSIVRKKDEVMKVEKAQKIIIYYNSLQRVFIHYELLHHRDWCSFSVQVHSALSIPLLCKEESGLYTLNLHPGILELIRETETLRRLKLNVPDLAQVVVAYSKKLSEIKERMKALMKRNLEIRKGIPYLFINLAKSQLLKLQKVFLPCLSVVTWSSLNIPDILLQIEHTLDEVEIFCKEDCNNNRKWLEGSLQVFVHLILFPLLSYCKALDMKEARIDEVLEVMSKTSMIYLPSEALPSIDLRKKNMEYQETIAQDMEMRSNAVEDAVIELINKFVSSIHSPLIDEEEKYFWLNYEKIPKPSIKSHPDATQLSSDIDDYDIDKLKIDCMEVYSYFNQKNIDALVKATKRSLDVLRKRASASSILCRTKHDPNHIMPMLLADIILHIPNVNISPSLETMQTHFSHIVQSVLEVPKAVVQWGQRNIKFQKMSTCVRAQSSELPSNQQSESNKTDCQEATVQLTSRASSAGTGLALPTVTPSAIGRKNYFRHVAEHKDVIRQTMALQGIILLIKNNVQKVLEGYHLKYKHLWETDKEEELKTFVDSDPLTIDIRDRFIKYAQMYDDINGLPRINIVGPLEMNLENFKTALIVEWKGWKYTLGKLLVVEYGKKLLETVNFISDKNVTLQRKIKDLDDVRIAMNCLESVRENFIKTDQVLIAIEETYAIFAKYGISVPPEDIEKVDGLQYSFSNLNNAAKAVQALLCEVQDPMKKELLHAVGQFAKDVETFDTDFEENGPMIEGLEAKEASDRVIVFQSRFDELWHKFEVYSSGEKLFGMLISDYPILHERKKQFNLLQKLYSLYLQVNNSVNGYFELAWSEVDIEAIMTELQEYQNRCRKLPKGMKDWPAFIELKKKIDDFNETCPLLQMMANKAMKERHWKRLEKLTGCVFDIESDMFTLKHVMDAPLLKFKDDVEDICVSAVKERDIESKLKQVIADWAIVDLQFSTFKTRGELLLKGTETGEIIAALEDSLMVLNSLASNRYNAPFKKEIQNWVWRLSTTSEILENWLVVQNLWVYLEAVFVGGDIAKQLPAEAKRFSNIDRAWVKIMTRAREVLNVVEVCVGDEMMRQLLPHLLEQLESCQKSLTGYLEQKRLIFPRFFFVSDPALLEILGQASDSHTIQAHLLNVFENVARVQFHERDYDRILAIISREDETIQLEKSVLCVGGVEVWLGTLLSTSRYSLASVIGNCWQFFGEPDFSILTMVSKFPAQVGLLGMQLYWTRESEKALKLAKFSKTIMKATNDLFLNILNMLIDQTTRDLTKFERVKFETLVTIHVHQRDIFDDLCRLKIKTTDDFEWLKQERFYFVEDKDECIVKITDVDFIYQNEFLGCTDRLVITPLTDRCYITLAQAIGMNMGGAPAGPAGTGKTETVKDMGKSLGKYVVVFNCSDQMDFRGLARIYKGLAQSGSWGCFDEFNRIELPVLSVAAQQIYIVLTARKERKSSFIFSDGDTVTMNPEFGIFITMNPGYAGRQELPENLKIMFRSVAMMVPDRQIIMRVKLAACGFKDNINLARKFFVLYKLCEEQLSKQVHYDFGLRNILSVLRTLGAQKRANPTETEDSTVMRVLRDMNVSKLVDEDEPLFISLIEDLFVGLKLTSFVHKEVLKAIATVCTEMVLINHPPWNLKIIQLYETSLVRHGLMTLGPTGAGKTKCIHALMKAMTECGRPHKEMRMNPKAITAPQMFGKLDAATNDWTDGIFSTLWRRSLKIKKNENVWIVLDGPVDAVWIENLNSVLDDNKTLTLANGDRIVMAPNSKLVFEPDNVDNASPATISRMGMVFMSASVLTWEPILEGWFKSRPPHESDQLRPLFHRIYGDVHLFVQTKLTPKMKILEALYIRQCVDIIMGLVDTGGEEKKSGQEEKIHSSIHMERLFLFSMIWSLGAVLELDDRKKLENFILRHESKMNWPKLESEFDTIFDYLVGESGEWHHWTSKVEEYLYPKDSVPEYSSILVPNVDNVRTGFLIDNVAKQRKGVLLIGEQGTAKTVMIKSYMQNYDPEIHLSKSLNFSSATTPNMFQRTIESYLDKRVGTTYGPPNNRRMTIFIDDINMPVINEWGDQVTNEIVRQLMEMAGFYSLDKPGDFSTILDVQFLAAMCHPGGGRNDIPPRLKRRFCIFNCTLPSERSMDKIFSVLGEGYFCLERFKGDIVEFLPKLIPLTRIVWQQTKIKMLPTPAKFHYVFNLRDLSRIWEGILHIQDAECQTLTMLLKLWKHEVTRVISDRFTNQSDKDWFLSNLLKIAEDYLESDFSLFDPEETYFVDFLRDIPEATGDEPEDFVFEPPKIYEEIPSWDFLKEKLLSYVVGYNEITIAGKMDLVFFKDAMVHLMIISRIIRTPRGNALLVGVGGSGKQSLTRLSSFIANYKIHQITLTRAYNVSNFMDDIKFLYRVAGFQGKGISFIFTDNEIKDEAFLEFLNNVLSAGEVANLFAKDELDEITNDLIPIMKKKDPKRIPTGDNLYDFFITQARYNLHIVLCFSPVGEKFRSRSLKFPGLISGCTVDWFSRWPVDALEAVSEYFISNFHIVSTPKSKNELMKLMAAVQDGVADICVQYFDKFRRQTYVTPKSYLSFLAGYKDIYFTRYKNIDVLAKQMNTGLEKLVEAAKGVDELKKDLVIKEKEIVVASAKAEEVLADVSVVASAAEKVKAEVSVVASKAKEIYDVIAVDKGFAEEKLEAARPALEAAEAALLTIKGADIATVRKLGKPPYLITLIMDCVLILFQRRVEPVHPDLDKTFLIPNWAESLKMMADTRFLFNLQNFPKDKINAETVDLMLPYLSYSQYTYDNAKVACGNVAGLIQWTISMRDFYEINKEVLPLKANLAVQQTRLNAAEKELKEAQQVLQAKENELASAQAEFDSAMASKQEVLDVANRCKAKMDAATALINGLSGEQKRWTEQSSQFKDEIDRLIGDVLILTGFLSYAGPFNQEYRSILQTTWFQQLSERKIPVTVDLNIIENLTDAPTIGEWNLQGLPNDELSIQNGIIVTKASRFPLLIDPQSQGITWIKNKEKDYELQVTSLNHKYFRNHIEDCLSFGRPLLIEDVLEELDPALDNILEKNFIKIGTSLKVKVGDKEMDFHKDFRLYITTKLSNPSYTPEVTAKTSIIDFAVTMKGLEDQLLGRVILTEKKELENERTSLIQEVTSNKRKMKDLEQNLLIKLTTVQGSLVDDDSVINVLNVTKDTAISVNEKLKIAVQTEQKINAAREEFRPVATRGSVLYFLIVEMSMVNCMYQTSLAQFLERFDLSMARSEKSVVASRRIVFIIEYLTYEIFKYKCRGLYEEHKYLFTLLLALKIDLQRNFITYEEFQNFIKGGGALDLNTSPAKPCKWITDVTWLNVVQLSALPTFKFILSQIPHSEKAWKAWYDKPAPEEEVIPDNYEILDPFRKLLIIRAWCPDRALAQSKKYLGPSLGVRFTEPVILDIDQLINESRQLTPMICFLSMGSDPTPLIEAASKRHEIECRTISMGQGQEIHARKLVALFMHQGGWVLLQNCHLGLEYMNELFIALSEAENPHLEFRIWITTEPHPKFPISLLQISLKFTNEPPQGVRAGLKRTYSTMGQDMLDFSRAFQYLPMLYAVSFLHTVVQERRKFGPIGWNIPYEFNYADWYASTLFIQNHLDEIDPKVGVSWTTVRYMLGEVQYGGRVTDDYDKRLLITFAKVWFSDAMFSEAFFFTPGYKIMQFQQIGDYLDAFELMSPTDPPSAYGLHSNADITYQSNTTKTLLDTIISIQPKESSGGGGETREAAVTRQSTEMLSKLPKDYDPFEVKERLKIMGILSSMNIFLRQEIDRMQKVISIVRKTLKDLLLAIEGTIIMNDALRDALDNIYDARVPNLWKRSSWVSTSIGFWYTELLERNQQFATWIFQGRPAQFWMTGFFNPQGFLTAMRQEVARAHKGWPLDSVTLHNDVTKFTREEIRSPPPEGVYVYGLFLEGAGWDKRNNRLVESVPKVLSLQMPVIHLYAINSTAPKDPKLYHCPVYKKPNRTDLTFITPLWLPCKFTPDHWVLRGVALLCDTK